MTYEETIEYIKSHGSPENVVGMARFGINANNTYGVSMPTLRGMAKQLRKNHTLAEQLWASGIHEARILAGLIDDPAQVTEEQMERWVLDFDSWDVCDQVCSNLFGKTPYAFRKAVEWSARSEEFVKRAGFVLMTQLAVHNKKAPDEEFERFLPIIIRESSDDRNFVRKAVNWALRQIGKRNHHLNELAIRTAEEIRQKGDKASRWIASDALRELTGEIAQRRLGRK